MSSLTQRQLILDLFDEAVNAGARRQKACEVIGIDAGTLRRWRPKGQAQVQADARPDAERPIPANSYSEAERQLIGVCQLSCTMNLVTDFAFLSGFSVISPS